MAKWWQKKRKTVSIGDVVPDSREPEAFASDWTNASLGAYYGRSVFNGEKDFGEVGLIREYTVDYTNLSRRVNEMMLTNDVAKMIIKRYSRWIVSSGLQLELNPELKVLQYSGLPVTKEKIEELNDHVEAFFNTWANSKRVDHKSRANFYRLQKLAFRSVLANGDILTVLRYKKGTGVTVELIDTQRLINPVTSLSDDGITWKNGVRLDGAGKITGFCVTSGAAEGYTIIDAVDTKTGLTQAFLYNRETLLAEDVRGLSALSGSLDKLAKIDRYIEATVGGAEERAKIAYSIEHDLNGTGENPLGNITRALTGNDEETDNPVDVAGDNLANRISATTNKQTFNMPQGSSLKMHNAPADKDMGGFTEQIIDIISGSVGIPPNVVRMLYTDSFSASRAAINDWQHTIRVDRADFTDGWLRPIFEYWFAIENMLGNIRAVGYLDAFKKDNRYVLDAYTRCEFVGEMFPHIDPLKEVNAERAKLGPAFDNVPLTTHEKASRQVGNSNADAIIQQAMDEYRKYSGEFVSESNK